MIGKIKTIAEVWGLAIYSNGDALNLVLASWRMLVSK